MRATERLLGELQNYGGPLGPEKRDVMRRMLLRPDLDAWQQTAPMVITSYGDTLEFAIWVVDKDFAQGEVPDPFTVRRAMLWAAERENVDVVLG